MDDIDLYTGDMYEQDTQCTWIHFLVVSHFYGMLLMGIIHTLNVLYAGENICHGQGVR